MSEFDKQYNQVRREESFGPREVGISHPDTSAFVKMADNGDIEITACPGLTFILHPQDKSFTIVADKVRFILGGKEVFQINDLILNTDATNYAEPTFLKKDISEHTYLYDGTADYLEE